MRRIIVTGVAMLAALVVLTVYGCQGKQHPVSVFIAPQMEEGTVDKIAVFPFATALHDSDDPNGEAPMTMEKYFVPKLDERNDYNFINSGTVLYAIDRADMNERAQSFLASYPTTDKPDMEFLGALADALKCDAFLIPVVDLWQKDEVDYQENASPFGSSR